MDSGMVLLKPLREVLKPGDSFVSPEDDRTTGIYNAFIATVPRQSILLEAINMSVENVQNETYGDGEHGDLAITGPLVLSKAFTTVMGKPVVADKDYGGGVRLIAFIKDGSSQVGDVLDRKEPFVTVKYPGYYEDMKWYTNSARYGDLFKARAVYKFKPSPKLYEHQRRLLRLLETFEKICRENGITYWVSDGTLLGAVREKGIIGWDDDIDVNVPSTSIDKLKRLIPLLRSKGYDLFFDDHIWRFTVLGSDFPSAGYIDLFEMKDDEERYTYVEEFNSKRFPKGYVFHREIYPLKLYSFEGLQVPGPNDSDSYLTRLYGDWRIPQKWPTHLNHD